MTAPNSIVVVGSSVGGVQIGQSLRSMGHSGRIVLVGQENELPYDKPPLSKQFLSGAWGEERCQLLSEEAAHDAQIELRLGHRAVRLDVEGKAVHLADGTQLEYQSVVIATGARARPSPWPVTSGSHVMRTIEDARGLRDDLNTDSPVVVIGGGFIGSEVASTARALGKRVTVVDPQTAPMMRVLGGEVSVLLEELYGRHGVQTRFGVGIQSMDGESGNLRVALTTGEVLRAGTVVVGIGAIPNDEWLKTSKLDIDDGVVCDEFGRARHAPDVFAVGDVARWFEPRSGEAIRTEHWTSAADQAACVAHNIVNPGDLVEHRPNHYIWSDQFDCKLQIVGRVSEASQCIGVDAVDGQRPQVLALYSDDAVHLTAAVVVNWPKAFVLSRRLIRGGSTICDAYSAFLDLNASGQRGRLSCRPVDLGVAPTAAPADSGAAAAADGDTQ